MITIVVLVLVLWFVFQKLFLHCFILFYLCIVLSVFQSISIIFNVFIFSVCFNWKICRTYFCLQYQCSYKIKIDYSICFFMFCLLCIELPHLIYCICTYLTSSKTIASLVGDETKSRKHFKIIV